MVILLIFLGLSKTASIFAEDGTDLTLRQQLLNGLIIDVYDTANGKQPGRRMLANKNWGIIKITDMSYAQAIRLVDGPDDVWVDQYGPRLNYFWRLFWADLPQTMQNKLSRNEELTVTLAQIKAAIRHRETNLTLDKL